jgi:HK97 family phage prohead protease
MFLNHNSDNVLGSTKSKTLRLEEDEVGLRVEADLPETSAGRDLSVLMQRGDVDSMSFGFEVLKDEWSADYSQRELIEVRLWEVSPITSWPAYPATSAFVRHLAELTDTEPEPLADALRLLIEPDARLTPEQRDMLLSAINARTDEPLIAPNLARWRERAATLGIARQ